MFRIAIAFALSFMGCAVSFAQAVSPLPLDHKVNGRSGADLSAEWWKWAMASPQEINPVRDPSGKHCAVGQSGEVWFLAGGFGSARINRTCTIPAGKYIFFPVVNMAYWPREENSGYTCERAKTSASLNNDTAVDLFASVDGVEIPNVKTYRARTDKCFDIFERVPKSYGPPKAFPSASDGYWLLLAPLPKGTHTIKFGGKYNRNSPAYGRMVQDIEYYIVVE
jgi:hypothetical protein